MAQHDVVVSAEMAQPNIVDHPFEILEAITTCCNSDSLLQWRLSCSLGRKLANSVVQAVTISGAHLSSSSFSFSKLQQSAFPRLRSLTLLDSPDAPVTDAFVITATDSSETHAVLGHVENLDLRGCSYLSSALGVHSLLSLTPNLVQLTATRWMDAGGLLAASHLTRLQKLELGDDKVWTSHVARLPDAVRWL
jgi:hypothetical protein